MSLPVTSLYTLEWNHDPITPIWHVPPIVDTFWDKRCSFPTRGAERMRRGVLMIRG